VIDTDTRGIKEGLMRQRKVMLTTVAVCFLAGAMSVLLALREWNGWATPLLVIVPGLLTVAVIRSSVVSAAYLAQMTVYFGVTSLFLGSHWQPRLVSTVLLSALALATGTIMGGLSTRRASTRTVPWIAGSWLEPHWSHWVMAGGLMGVSAYLSLSGGSGYEAQLIDGRSTPAGVLGTLSVTGPVVTIMLLLAHMRSGTRSIGVIGFAGVQMLVLGLSGFRGASVVFLLALLLGAALTLPSNSVWRRKSRLVIILPVLLGLTVSTLVLGASVKNAAATRLGVASSGTELVTLDNALLGAATRFQLSSSLNTAIEYEHDAAAREAVSWAAQLQAVVPRVLWPEKPTVDYGQRVSVAMYGLTYGESSSTVTTIGDQLLNFGPIGLTLIGLSAGYAFRRLEDRTRSDNRGVWVFVAAVVIYTSIGLETPVVLVLIGILRNGLVAGALWAAATWIARPQTDSVYGSMAQEREPDGGVKAWKQLGVVRRLRGV